MLANRIRQIICVHRWGMPRRNPALGPSFRCSECEKCGKVRNGHTVIRRMPDPFINGLAPIPRAQLAR